MNIVKILLKRGININNESGDEAFLRAAADSDSIVVVEMFLDRGIDINIEGDRGETALHKASEWGCVDNVKLLLQRDIKVCDDIEGTYAPLEYEDIDENGNIFNIYEDCRPIIFAEVEHRRKRALFDSFINHHIEYQPYINNIYSRCYPTGSAQVAKPPVGWSTAEAIRDKY